MCIGPFKGDKNKVKSVPDPIGTNNTPSTAASAGTASTAGPNQSTSNK